MSKKSNPVTNPGDIETFFKMFNAVRKGKYPMPWAMSLWMLFFLFYFISPIDIIPDIALPILGFTDDAALLFFTGTRVKKELKKFRAQQGNADDSPKQLPEQKDEK
ncbi:uncharacterized membrane protein YkvA (DUF1232 family) [Elusimicrobium simillimum]|uniref:DUF1232 domain-containing protein n=1 Tax=Elusimicrobium simillimum TaxID=3143438 RepID=UPI003C6FC2C7